MNVAVIKYVHVAECEDLPATVWFIPPGQDPLGEYHNEFANSIKIAGPVPQDLAAQVAEGLVKVLQRCGHSVLYDQWVDD